MFDFFRQILPYFSMSWIDIIDIIINQKDTEKEKENKKKLLKNLFK